MLNVGIIGAGDFGAEHAKAIIQTPNVNLTAASRTNQKALNFFCQQFSCKGYTDYQALLKLNEIDAVVIATPHHLHTSIVEQAARAGKHILLEKPMAPSLPECDQILKVVKECNVHLMLGHINHFVPAYIKAKEILESGELGDIVYAYSTMTRPWMTSNRRDWHLNRSTGGGMWLTIGVHVLDQLCWLVDQPVSSIRADLQTRFHKQDADDFGVALIHFASNISATANVIGYQTGVFNFLTELTCTKGLMKISHRDGLFLGKDESWHKIETTSCENWMEKAMLNQWQAFRHAIEQNTEMPITGEYARQVMQLAFAAEHSSKEKREISL